MKKYILILFLVFSTLLSCGSRKVQKSNVTEDKKETTETHIIDTSRTIIDTNIKIKVIDTSTTCEIEIIPIDTTKPFMYNNKVFKNAILRIKKHKNNISTETTEKVSEKRDNAVITNTKTQEQTQIEVVKKDIDKKESVLSYWWILVLLIIGYVTYRKYIK